ncbi:MAG: DUF1016 N-terminal domain-containing protein [Syntrophales bacterium]|jgi:predicted nuclease of restriction endonuclease-like (RecB) superfamily|nr:DUF1016 N-terminal domain-containing protein [Syntrophales bacterium]
MKKTKPASPKLSLTLPKPAGQMRRTQTALPEPLAVADEASLLADLRALIQSARQRVATVANATQTLLYWHVGRRLLKENLQDGRAAYGKRILATVSRELLTEFGEGFTLRSLYRSIQFFELFPDETIVSTLSAQLSWSHFIELLPLKDPLARDFYAEMCRIERWDVRTLRQKIGGMLFQRTALSKNAKAVISAEIANLREGRMTPDTVFRDPYFLDFLGLKGAYSERDLESAILREIESFLRNPPSASFSVPQPMPNRWNSSNWMPNPSASVNTSLNCHLWRSSKPASTKPSSMPESRPQGARQPKRISHERLHQRCNAGSQSHTPEPSQVLCGSWIGSENRSRAGYPV